jgi:hypothetical protein
MVTKTTDGGVAAEGDGFVEWNGAMAASVHLVAPERGAKAVGR